MRTVDRDCDSERKETTGNSLPQAEFTITLCESLVPSVQLNPGPIIQLELEGEVTIALAAQLKRELCAAVDMGRAIAVSLEGVSMLDITAIQLLWAAARHARMAGCKFTFVSSLSNTLVAGLSEAGIPVAFLLEGES